LQYKYSGPIKEQCICEICTCGWVQYSPIILN
jgi:hypothetical protein